MIDTQIDNKIIKLVNECGTIDPFKISKLKDYVVQKLDMPLRLRGYTTAKRRINIIFINDLLPYEVQMQTCAHELGHIQCGHTDNAIYTSINTLNIVGKKENEANKFMLQLFLSQYTPMDLHGLTKDQVANMIGIERKLMELL